MAVLLYQGHGSYRIVTGGGFTVYIDPYAGDGYDLPADLILVTHDHYDHNRIDKVPRRSGCRILTWKDAIKGGKYQHFTVQEVEITAVPACNRNHDIRQCVGYVLRIDGKTLYAAGDTSKTSAMSDLLPSMHLDWCLLPIDGVYNMGAAEASECARLINAAHTIPIHVKPGMLYDRTKAEQFVCKGRVLLEPGEEICL